MALSSVWMEVCDADALEEGTDGKPRPNFMSGNSTFSLAFSSKSIVAREQFILVLNLRRCIVEISTVTNPTM